MEEKLKEILANYEVKIERYEKKVEDLAAKMGFCQEHNFKEEYRIAEMEYQALDLCVYGWRQMHREITDLLNAWLS